MRGSHVCLTGESLTGDWELIRSVKSRHRLTLVEHLDPARLAKDPLFKTVGLIVVDCAGLRGAVDRVFAGFKALRRASPRLIVLIVDGGLDQMQLAKAFHMGVRDYFRAPHESRLLAERIHSLCDRESGGRGRAD